LRRFYGGLAFFSAFPGVVRILPGVLSHRQILLLFLLLLLILFLIVLILFLLLVSSTRGYVREKEKEEV
jgi:hypothetical protein